MTDKDTALRLALEALENITSVSICEATHHAKKDRHLLCEECPNEVRHLKAITAIKAALLSRSDGEAKVEPEYYGLTKDHLWMSISKEHYDRLKPEFRMACYTTPPQRKPLTDEEIMDALKLKSCDGYRAIVRAIEAAYGIIDPTDQKGKA